MTDSLDPIDQLTYKQVLLVEEYLKHGDIYEAALTAGYKGRTREILYDVGRKVLRSPKVREAMAEVVAKSMKNAEISVESILRDLELAKKEAMIQKYDASGNLKRDLPAFLKATELQGKYLKMFSDKIDLNVSGQLDVAHDLSNIPTDTLEKMIGLYDEAKRTAADSE